MKDPSPAEPAPSDCTLVIPAYNEENRIGRLLAELPESGCRFIFVCDGRDGTPRLIRDFAAAHPGLALTCLEFPDRLGKGGAIRQGLMAGTTRYLGFMDADGSTSVGEMLRLFSHLDHADGAIGSRWVDGATLHVRQGFLRRTQSRGFNLLVRHLFNLPFHDTQCGAKVFRRPAIFTVIGNVASSGFEFDVELLWRLRQRGFLVEEVPLAWHDMPGSRVGPTDVLRMLLGLIRLRMRTGGA